MAFESNARSSSTNSSGRSIADTLMNLVSKYALLLVAVAALGVSLYGFTISFAEGIRALIFFLIPSLWGAFSLAVLDGRPTALDTASGTLLNVMAAIAGLTLAAVIFLDAPVSIANIPLGIIEAAFFVMLVADGSSPFPAQYSETGKTIVRMVLILATVLCLAVAVAL